MIDYSVASVLTSLRGISAHVVATDGGDPVSICAPVHSLVIQPGEAALIGLPHERFATNQMRPAAALIRAAVALDPAPIVTPRPPHTRVVGTCRHFAVLSCALLRHGGVPSRVRCGFATYFQSGQALDHWVTEYWTDSERRWVRIDSEILGGKVLARPEDLGPADFLSGGEAWIAYRNGEIDAGGFGVHGTEHWGSAEIRGNVVRDLAALNKVEMLPWDVWGGMAAAYQGRSGPGYDGLLDAVASACASDDRVAVAELYRDEALSVPAGLIR